MRTEEQEYTGLETVDIAEYNRKQEDQAKSKIDKLDDYTRTTWGQVLYAAFIAWWAS